MAAGRPAAVGQWRRPVARRPPTVNVAIGEFNIADERFQLPLQEDPPMLGDHRRQKGVGRLAYGEQHGAPERFDVLVPEGGLPLVATAKQPQPRLQILQA